MLAFPTLLLAGVCAGHFLGVVREDYGGYLRVFAWARDASWYDLPLFIYRDYGFGALLLLFGSLLPANDGLWFFLIALLGLGVKFYCFRLHAPVYWVALLVHVSMFFVLHDYTQLRASLGIAFLMLGITFLVSRSQNSRIAGIWVLAASFHVQTLVAIVFAIVWVLSFGLFISMSILSLFGGEVFIWASLHFDRLIPYAVSATTQAMPNPFSSAKLYQYLTLAGFLYYFAEIRRRNWRIVELSGWFLLAGLSIFMGFLRFPSVAHRLSEMFFAFMPFLISGLYMLMPRRFGIPFVGAAVVIGVWASYRILNVWQ